MSDSAFKKLTIAEKVFYDLVWSNLITVGLESLYTAAPYLRPFSFAISFIIKNLSDKLYEGLVLVVDLQAIIFVNEVHRAEYNKALIKLRGLAQTKGIDSPEFLEAREDAKSALAHFVRFGGH